MQPKPGFRSDACVQVGRLPSDPAFRVLLEGRPRRPGIDVLTTGHVSCSLGQPLFRPALLAVGEGFALFGAVRPDVPGPVTETVAVAVGLDLHRFAVRTRFRLVPAVLDVSGHQAASPSWESTQARMSFGSKRRCRPTRNPRGAGALAPPLVDRLDAGQFEHLDQVLRRQEPGRQL